MKVINIVNEEIGMEKELLNIIKKNKVIKVHGNEFKFLKNLNDKQKKIYNKYEFSKQKEVCSKSEFSDYINHELKKSDGFVIINNSEPEKLIFYKENNNFDELDSCPAVCTCISTCNAKEINFKGNHFKTNALSTEFRNDLFLKNFIIDMSVYEKENNKYSKYIEDICLPMLEGCCVKNQIFYVFNEKGDISNAKQQVTLFVTTKNNIEEIKKNFEKSEMTDDQKMKLDLLVKIKEDMAEKNIESNDFQLTFEGDYVYTLYDANLVIYKKDEKEKKYSMHRQYNLDNENMKMHDLTFYEDRIFLLGEKYEQDEFNNYFFVFDKNGNLQTKLRVSENIESFCKSKCIDRIDCLPLINIKDYSDAEIVNNYKNLDIKKKKYFDECVKNNINNGAETNLSSKNKNNCIII